MKELLDYVSTVTDFRQEKKVLHKMMDIIMLVFFATLANADDWVEIEVFGREHEVFLCRYLELPNGIPSHDTIQRVFAMVSSEFLETFQKRWNEMLSSDEGEKVKHLLAIAGKTQRGNGNKNQKANHIVSAVDERGFCLGQKRADYVLALKANQGSLLEDVSWLSQKKEWSGLRSMILTRNTVTGADGGVTVEERYFISSLPVDIEEAERAVRGHWMIESYHWHLDVTFREDGNHTLEKQASYNLNIIRKLSLNILKLLEVGSRPLSMKKKRYTIGTNPEKHLEKLMSL